MGECGLCELWIECDIVGVNTTQKVMAVKGYARSMRTHKLTLQALWQILLPRLNDHLYSVHEEIRTELAPIWTPFDTDDIAQKVRAIDQEKDDNYDDDYAHNEPPQVSGQRVTEMKAD